MLDIILMGDITGWISIGAEKGCEKFVDISQSDYLPGEWYRAVTLEFLARVFAGSNTCPIQFLCQVMIWCVGGNAFLKEPNPVKPIMVLKVLGVFIDVGFSLVDIVGAIVSQSHGRKRSSVGPKEGPSVHIHIHASVITWEPNIKGLISCSLNSICQFRVQ